MPPLEGWLDLTEYKVASEMHLSKGKRQMEFRTRSLMVALITLYGIACVEGQIDPARRELIQLGYNQAFEGRAPISGYAFYYNNAPYFHSTNLALRLAVAPVYLDSELGIRSVLGPNTDLGLGLAGGGFADTYSEIRHEIGRASCRERV